MPAVARRKSTRSSPGVRKIDSSLFGDDRTDGWQNSATQLGGRNGRNRCNRWVPNPGLGHRQLEEVYAGSALMRTIVDREPDDCTREGLELEGIPVEDQMALNDHLEEVELMSKFADGGRWGQLFGGGAIFMQVDDNRPQHAPIDMANILAIRQTHVFERPDISVARWSEDLGSPHFGKPLVYRLSMGRGQIEVHADRMLMFDGQRLSRQLRLSNDGFGGSIVDQVWDQFVHWCITHEYLAESITNVTQGVLKLKGLEKALKSGNGQKIKKRLQALQRGMSVIGDMIVDADGGEDYSIATRTMTGFKEALEAFGDALVAVVPQPKSILFGQVPGGLNSGEAAGDWKSWTSYCGASQKRKYSPPARKYLNILVRSRLSPIAMPDRIVIVWRPLFTPAPLEVSQIHAANATARGADITSGVVSPDEARRQDDVAAAYRLTEDEIGQTANAENTDARRVTPVADLPEPPKLDPQHAGLRAVI